MTKSMLAPGAAGLFAIAIFGSSAVSAGGAAAEPPAADAAKDKPAAAPAAAKPAEGKTDAAAPAGGGGGAPLELIKATEKGQLKSTVKAEDTAALEAGKKLYMSNGCNGCHGGTGGGGMGPPLTNPTWIYGNDDDTLFRLIALGSKDLLAAGFTRKGSEAVKGPMPPFGEIIKKDDDLWKIIAWVKSVGPKK